MTRDGRREAGGGRRGGSRGGILLELLLFAAGLAACGKKGDPQPPLPRGPNAVSDLSVEQEGDEAVLTFAFPDRLLTGAPLTDLASIEIYRVVKPSPALVAPRRTGLAAPAPTGEAGLVGVPGAAARRAATNVRLAEQAFYQESRRIAALPLAAISDHTRGASYSSCGRIRR